MPAPKWSDEIVTEAASKRAAGMSWSEIGSDYGVSGDVARLRCFRGEEEQQEGMEKAVTVEQRADRSVFASSELSAKISSLPALIEHCQVDMDLYAVERFIVNKWPVGAKLHGRILQEPLFQVKGWFRPIGQALAFSDAAEKIIERMSDHAPSYKPVKRVLRTDGHLLVISPTDIHFGMRSWAAETGENYDTQIARRRALTAVETLIERAKPYGVSKILFIVGNDILHMDGTIKGSGGQTTAGTPLDVDDRWQKVFEVAHEVMIECIDRCRLEADTEVHGKPGNHDEQLAWALVRSLQSWYRHDECVTVKNPVSTRSYFEWETILLGISHGHKGKVADLPLLMATEMPEAWARCKDGWWAWLCGHKHAAKMDEKQGVRIHTLPSLAVEDAWHAAQGYRHIRAMEALLFSKDDYAGSFSVKAEK